ncbi:MAG: transposase [Anaerolineaceae bacterium]|nr:transposase [Anaerolineaceae bacterium]
MIHRQRKQIRLRGYDYRNVGAYFVTICTHQRRCTFGTVRNGVMRLNDWGQIVAKIWRTIPEFRPYVILDVFQCMPNHVHLILWIISDDAPNVLPENVDVVDVGQRRAFALHQRQTEPERGVKSKSLGSIIGGFKSAVTREINDLRGEKYPPIWQGRFHDRIIRNERELEAIRRYIRANPANWREDQDYDAGLDDYLNNIAPT